VRALLVALAAALVLAPAAAAHEGGKAQPRIAVAVTDAAGLERTIAVRLTDADGGGPVDGATVTATGVMTAPHVMRLAPWRLAGQGRGLYRARVRFLMPATWSVEIVASGAEVVKATAVTSVTIESASAAAPATTTPTPLPTRLEDEVSGTDVLNMALLWLHATSALGWILGVVALALALSSGDGGGWRAALASWYRRAGAWAHWALAGIVVGTGVYQMLRVTPFPLAWGADEARALREVPYGALYEAILFVKLGLFAGLVVTGTQVLLRTLHPRGEAVAGGAARRLVARLGPAGVLYLALVPLVLGAAVALRYIHVLSHVGEVLAGSG
jgi:hypothetical protein